MDEPGQQECPCIPQQRVQISPRNTRETVKGFQEDCVQVWVMFQNSYASEQHKVGGLAVRNDVSGQGQYSREKEADVGQVQSARCRGPSPASLHRGENCRAGVEISLGWVQRQFALAAAWRESVSLCSLPFL